LLLCQSLQIRFVLRVLCADAIDDGRGGGAFCFACYAAGSIADRPYLSLGEKDGHLQQQGRIIIGGSPPALGHRTSLIRHKSEGKAAQQVELQATQLWAATPEPLSTIASEIIGPACREFFVHPLGRDHVWILEQASPGNLPRLLLGTGEAEDDVLTDHLREAGLSAPGLPINQICEIIRQSNRSSLHT